MRASLFFSSLILMCSFLQATNTVTLSVAPENIQIDIFDEVLGGFALKLNDVVFPIRAHLVDENNQDLTENQLITPLSLDSFTKLLQGLKLSWEKFNTKLIDIKLTRFNDKYDFSDNTTIYRREMIAIGFTKDNEHQDVLHIKVTYSKEKYEKMSDDDSSEEHNPEQDELTILFIDEIKKLFTVN